MPTMKTNAAQPPKTPIRRKPLQTLSSTLRQTTPKPKPPPPPQNALTALADLDSLNEIIVSELTFWMNYLKALPALDFSALTSTTSATPDLRTKALIYVLETLPTRHQALASIYRDTKIEPVVVPGECCNLLARLRNEEESAEGHVGAEHEKKIFTGKMFRQSVVYAEGEMKALEEGRIEELKGLMQMVAMLRLLGNGGLLGNGEVKLLADAMKEAGLGVELSDSKSEGGGNDASEMGLGE